MSDTLNTVILGIIEGITEFLPISSTGHLLVAEQFLGSRSELFNVGIQAGAILAIVLIYRTRLVDLTLHVGNPQNRDYLFKLTVSVLITLILGFIATRLGFKLPETVVPISIAMLVGGVAILVIEAYVAPKPKSADVTWSVAIWVGLPGQILAAVSSPVPPARQRRFSPPCLPASLCGRPLPEFAFLVGIPTMFAANGL